SSPLRRGGAGGTARRVGAAPADIGVKLRIVQANVDQANKWRPENRAEIFNTYLDLSKSGGARGLDGISLVIWPETAVPFLLADSPDALAAISDMLPEGANLLVGSSRLVDSRDAARRLTSTRIYNSLLVVDHKGEV